MKVFSAYKFSRWIGVTIATLLFAVASIQAQEHKKDENKSKPADNPAPANKPHPATPPAQHAAPSQQTQHQPGPAGAQPQTPRQAPNQPSQGYHPTTPPSQTSRPFPQQNAPQAGQQPSRQPQQPMQSNRPGGFQPNQPGQPNRAGQGQQGQQGGFRGGNVPANRPQSQAPVQREVRTRGGDTVRHDAVGRVSEVHLKSGAVVYHAPSGVRRVEVVRPGGRVVVATAPGHGYVQRQVVFNNRTMVKRTYIVGGVAYARVYRPISYRGAVFNVYTPVRFYRPAFYAYVYNPWPRPIVYGWGWAGNPWYAYYGGYFTPYPVYASPALWLTDYLIASTLQDAYQERMAAAAAAPVNSYAPAGQVGLTPDVKQMISDEVRRQVDEARAEGQQMNSSFSANAGGNDAPPMFADNVRHVFVANTSLEVNSNAGDCAINEGDVLQMSGAPPAPGATTADVIVLASRGQSCPKGATVAAQLQDLQEMQNHMRETVDKGLGDLQARQGQNGLPALPSGVSGTIDTPLAAEAQPDTDVGGELTAVAQEADSADQAAVSQSLDTPASGPITLSLGQTIEDVKAIQGEPQKIMDLGSKKIYVYKDLKITFMDGKVTDVQ